MIKAANEMTRKKGFGGYLERGYFDLIHVGFEVGNKVLRVQAQQSAATREVVKRIELPKAVHFEIPVEFYAEFHEGRSTEVREVGDAENVAFRIDVNFDGMIAAVLGVVTRVLEVQGDDF
jgi:hypothetical protein